MKISHTENQETEIEVLDDVLCNQCGNSCKVNISTISELFNFEGIIELCTRGGYNSKIGDGVEYSFSICEDCLIVLFKTFKIPVTFTDC